MDRPRFAQQQPGEPVTAFLQSVWHFEAWRYLLTAVLLIAGGGFLVWSFMAPRNRQLLRALDARNELIGELRVKAKGDDHGD